MKRRLFAAAACLFLTFSVYSQAPLLPPTVAPTVFPSVTASPSPTSIPAASDTPSPRETVDPLVATGVLDVVVVADVLFPAGIAFQVSFGELDTELSSITMTVEQDGWTGQTVNIDPADISIDENDLSALLYMWRVGENPPRLFEPLTVTWSFTPRGGGSEVVETELVFADSKATWTIVEANSARARFAAADARATSAVISAQLAVLSELLDAGGRQLPPANVVLFPMGVSVDPCGNDDVLVGSQTTMEVPCDSDAAVALYEGQGWDLANVTIASPARTLVTDKIVRAAYPSLFASEEVPQWFKSGLIAYLAGSFNANDLETVRGAARSNSLLPSLDSMPSGAEQDQWRTQSTGTVVYMASQIGVVPMLDVLNRIDEGDSLSSVWLDQAGQSMNALNASWRNWIFSPRAEAAYSMPPSLAPTLTLVPTRTASFTPTATPTLTPSPTWTNTPIPSITPTQTPSVASGFEQPTAAPTHTPTVTLRPTITPRPPVAFSLDEVPDEPASPLGRSVAIAAAAAVIVVLLSTTFLVVTRRRK